MNETVIAAFYQFAPLADYKARRQGLLDVCLEASVLGTILLAEEGVNGTISGSAQGIAAVIAHIREFPGCAAMGWKRATAGEEPFHRIKVRLKKEIVTMGVAGLEPNKSHERYVEPYDWNAVITDPETLVIDTRNDYEVAIGAFEGAVNPHTASFREFPQWFREFRKTNNINKVAMYCTGGIRCEKSTAFLRNEGIEDVVHLKGGVLKYLEETPKEKSLWRGECFVFDQRVSVDHDLAPGSYDMCHACRRPITQDDMASPDYKPGVSCPACIGQHSARQLQSFTERQKQMSLAKARGETHIGVKRSEKT